jgi:CBS domain-containing protein
VRPSIERKIQKGKKKKKKKWKHEGGSFLVSTPALLSIYVSHTISPATTTTAATPLTKETGLWGLVPSTSMVLQLVCGSTLAVSCLEGSGITREEYGRNHPGGAIGRRLTLHVRDVMISEGLPMVAASEPVSAGIARMGWGVVLVVRDGDPCEPGAVLHGLFTDGDLRKRMAAASDDTAKVALFGTPMGQVCTRSPRTCSPDDLAFTIYEAMRECRDHIRPVTEAAAEGGPHRVIRGLVYQRAMLNAGL